MRLIISDGWLDALRDAGLDTFEALMAFRGGKVFSKKSHSVTRRLELNDGRVIFIKQDSRTKLRQILRALIRLRQPRTTTEKELFNLNRAGAAGFNVPEVVAYSQHEWWTRPGQGVLVEAALEGRPLDDFAACGDIPVERRRAAVDSSRKVLAELQRLRFDWKRDCKPEHFFVRPDGSIALLDVERLYRRRHRLPEKLCKAQFAVFDGLLPDLDNAGN